MKTKSKHQSKTSSKLIVSNYIIKAYYYLYKYKSNVTWLVLLCHFNWVSLLFIQSQQWKRENNVWNLFSVNNKDTRSTLLTWNKEIPNKIRTICSLLFNNIGNISKTTHDPDQVIFSCSNDRINNQEKPLLLNGLNFAFIHKNVKYSDYLIPFKLLFRDVNSLNFPDFDR